MALWLSLVAAVIIGVSGVDPVEKYGLTVFQIVGIYFAGGVIGGGIVGLMLPLARWVWGAVVLGILGMVPAYLGIVVLLDLSLITAVIAPLLVGGGSGLVIWMMESA